MKQKLLFFLLLSFTIVFATPKDKTTANPSIGIMMTSYPAGPGQIFFSISIKNTGEETLTNVYVTEEGPMMGMQFSFSTIASLAPGQEIIDLQAMKLNSVSCYDESQIRVHATPSSSAVEITDLSSNPNDHDNNFIFGSYYNDRPTISSFYYSLYGVQDGTYEDTNSNSIVDIGDKVIYSYSINFFGNQGEIVDNNAIVDQVNGTGVHYITQADVDLGYVYNSSFIMPNNWSDPCATPGYFSDASYCSCPNPDGANIITQLTTDLPNQISGNVKFNANNDNCATGLNFTNRRISTTDGTHTYSTYTSSTGDYHILIPNVGDHTTSALGALGANFSSNPISTTVTSAGSGMDYNNTDFCISSAANYADLRVNMFNVDEAMPGEQVNYRIYYSNIGSTNLNGTIQLTFDNGKLILPDSLPGANSSTATTLTWNYTNLLPFQTRFIYVSFTVLTPPTVNTNDVLPFTVVGNPIAGDSNPADNTFSWNQAVRSSFDPNDKTVIEGATITPSQTSNYLNYVTRFQNTGNAYATTVVIKETLDPKLDWNTFEPIASSHTSNIQIKNGNELTYTFSNIDLAYESTDEPGSHGWMAYRIKPKNNIAIGDIASSKSDIYFDYNLPITTNTVNTQVVALSVSDFVKGNFALYPNPASNYLVIEAKTLADSQYEIIDLNGKVLQTNTVESLKPIDISMLQSGFYMVNITTQQGKATYKLIKN